MKTNPLDVLVEDYLDKQNFDDEVNAYDALHHVCKDFEDRVIVREAITKNADNAFRSGFYTALSLMAGGVQ